MFALHGGNFGFLELCLRLFEFLVKNAYPVVERGDLLIFLKELLFVFLVLPFCMLGTFNGIVCLLAKSSKFLQGKWIL